MRFGDLTKDQRTEVKQQLLCERLEKDENRAPSYEELTGVDEAISDKEAEEAYAGTEFTLDDFCCGGADDRDGVLDELQEWAERELVDRNFAKSKGRAEPIHWDEHVGIEWARQFLLEHIKAVRP
jgi:hypothetical protein